MTKTIVGQREGRARAIRARAGAHVGLHRCAAAVLALATTAAGAQQISDGEVRIGVMTNLSGGFSDIAGPGSVLAARMAIDDFKAEAHSAFAIKLTSADHQNKADVASAKAREWYDQDKIDLIVDLPSSSAALAVVNVAKQKGTLAIVSGGASTRITNEECTPTALHWTYDSYSLAATTARAIVKQGGDTWFFITADYAGGLALEKDATDVITAEGGKVVGRTKHPFPGVDFASNLLAAQGSGAKVIGLANAGTDTVNTIKQAAEFGITPKQSLAATLLFISDVHALGLAKAQNMYLTEAFYWDLDEKSRAWSRRFFEVQKKMPTMVQAGVYSAVLHYLRAVKASGSDEPMTVVRKMQEMPISDAVMRNGKLRVDGRMVHDMYLLQVKTPAESAYPWDYYKVRQVVPAAQAFLPLEQSKCAHVKH